MSLRNYLSDEHLKQGEEIAKVVVKQAKEAVDVVVKTVTTPQYATGAVSALCLLSYAADVYNGCDCYSSSLALLTGLSSALATVHNVGYKQSFDNVSYGISFAVAKGQTLFGSKPAAQSVNRSVAQTTIAHPLEDDSKKAPEPMQTRSKTM